MGGITEFLAMAGGGFRLAQALAAGFGRSDDGGHVVGIPIHRDAAFQYRRRKSLCFEIALIGADQCRKLRAGGVSGEDDSIGIATVACAIVVNPANGLGDIAHDGFHHHRRPEAIAHGRKHITLRNEEIRLVVDFGFIAIAPTAAVDPDDDRMFAAGGRSIDIEHLARVLRFRVRDVALDTASRRVGQQQQESEGMEHGCPSL